MGRKRFLVVTGDDFGASPEVNRAILEAHERGILTSASLMVTGRAFHEAVSLAKSHPRLAVGLHLDCSSQFSSQLWKVWLLYQWSHEAKRELRLGIRSQLQKFKETGLPLSHVDGHQHMHLHPVVLEILIELSEEFGIRAIRLPREELGVTLRIDRGRLLAKCGTAWVFGWLRRRAEFRLRTAGIAFTERVYGLLQTGRVTERYLLQLIPRIQANRVEIYSHPTTAAENHNPLGASREQLEALLSDRVREALLQNGFQLATY